MYHGFYFVKTEDREFEPVEADLIVINEGYMPNVRLARQFFARVKPEAKVVPVGDISFNSVFALTVIL